MAEYTLTRHRVYHIPSSEFLEMLIRNHPDWEDAIDADDEDDLDGTAYLLGPEDCPPALAGTFEDNRLWYDGTRMDGYEPEKYSELLESVGGVVWWRGFAKQKKALFADKLEEVQALLAELGI